MKKKQFIILLMILFVALMACSKSKHTEIESEESFYGVVKEVNKENILVQVINEEGESEEGNLLYVSLDTQLEESDSEINLGDEITVYYNGVVARSYPGQVNMVYAIIVEKAAKENKE